MNGLDQTSSEIAKPLPLRFITATSIFDGHDVSINIVRRILQDMGMEVVHLGHNRGVDEIVSAALQEDADAIAISSYQGGHLEYFKYLVESLKQVGAGHIVVLGGGGGTITADEAAQMEAYGVAKVYTPEDGRQLGLLGMVGDMVGRVKRTIRPARMVQLCGVADHFALAQNLSLIEQGRFTLALPESHKVAPVIGITGTGGAGKSSVIDELLHLYLRHFPEMHIAVLAIDPTRHKSGGALLGDRIRLNSLNSPRIYLRSMATRCKDWAISPSVQEAIDYLKQVGFDLVLIETAGTGQADIAIAELVDFSLYVMTNDYGAPSQLEKIQMLDYADFVALNKRDRRGAEDALHDIRKQWRRNRGAFDLPDEMVPVYATMASYWQDAGIRQLFIGLCDTLGWDHEPSSPHHGQPPQLIANERSHYLSEIVHKGRDANRLLAQQVKAASEAYHYYHSLSALGDPELPEPLHAFAQNSNQGGHTLQRLRHLYHEALHRIGKAGIALLQDWPQQCEAMCAEHYQYEVRGEKYSGDNYQQSLSGLAIPKVAVPHYQDWGEQLRFLLKENLPGHYPYTAGVFPYRRSGEDPTRMFAGEGTPERTNRRFHYLALGQKAKRLSTAFDPITLYGENADQRPDIYGRIGMSGVSITCLDDMKKLYSGFDLCSPDTSVSMTINGPAPILLAWFLNTAIDQQVEKHLKFSGQWAQAEQKIAALYEGQSRPQYHGELPDGSNGMGLGMLGVTGDQLLSPEKYQEIKDHTLKVVRGTLQADILKEDQAQNECIFPLEFGLQMMGDVQQYFIDHQVKNYYSVSVSGYHIAEAGANPITQLAFTLANGFTLVEYYLARGMKVDDFAPQMSFFFSNGMDPEYAVIGRVARRIWARAMRDVYGANARSQKLKYHIQTSGRTLHAQTLGFNDIRTTLQALYAIYDNCNSLHTNAYDEALTTPTEESVRRALAIQMIINQELGLNYNQNSLQGAYIIDQLTDLVEEAVYGEFERLSQRGGVFGAMESLYQRSKIQDESLYYEHKKHDGSLPIVGVNTFLAEQFAAEHQRELIRSTEQERVAQVNAVDQLSRFHQSDKKLQLTQLQQAVEKGENSFACLMAVSKVATLGEISAALYEVVGRYRRRV